MDWILKYWWIIFILRNLKTEIFHLINVLLHKSEIRHSIILLWYLIIKMMIREFLALILTKLNSKIGMQMLIKINNYSIKKRFSSQLKIKILDNKRMGVTMHLTWWLIKFKFTLKKKTKSYLLYLVQTSQGMICCLSITRLYILTTMLSKILLKKQKSTEVKSIMKLSGLSAQENFKKSKPKWTVWLIKQPVL